MPIAQGEFAQSDRDHLGSFQNSPNVESYLPQILI